MNGRDDYMEEKACQLSADSAPVGSACSWLASSGQRSHWSLTSLDLIDSQLLKE